jgi:hypothetical protein
MGNNGRLIDQVRAAGQRTGERCWPLPLWDEYREQIDSTIADIKNSGGRAAGSITAGWFLKEFVDDDVPWVHLDIAGTAYRDEAAPYLRKGAAGVPTRLLIDWVRARAEHDPDAPGHRRRTGLRRVLTTCSAGRGRASLAQARRPRRSVTPDPEEELAEEDTGGAADSVPARPLVRSRPCRSARRTASPRANGSGTRRRCSARRPRA